MRVLVIEDDHSVRETLGMVLEACGHQPDLVNNGAEAIEFLKRSWPEAMLLDLTLQDMTGEEVYEKVRETFGKIPPTIVLSADPNGAQRVYRMLGARFLAKPYTIEELDHAIQQVVHGSEAA